MPTIPVSQRQVREQVLNAPGVNATIQVPQGGTAQALAGTVNNIGRLYVDERNKAEQVELEAFKTKARNQYNKSLHDKDTGFYSVKGNGTRSKFDTYQEGYNKFLEDEISNIGSDRVRQQAEAIKGRFSSDMDKSLNLHTSREMERYDDEVTKSSIESLENSAVLNSSLYAVDPQKVSESVNEQKELIAAFGARKGLPPESIKNMQLGASSSLHAGVVSNLLSNGEDLLAKDYFKQAQANKELDSKTTQKLSGLLEESTVIADGQRAVDEIMKQELSFGDSLKEARKLEGKAEQEAVRGIKIRFNEKKTIEREGLDLKMESLLDELDSIGSLSHVSAEERQGLTKQREKALSELAILQSKGLKVVTDPVIYDRLQTLSSTPALRDKFLKEDILASAHKLSRTDLRAFSAKQKSSRAQDGKFDVELGNVRRGQGIANTMLDAHGVSNEKKRAKFKRMVLDQALTWQQTHGKPVTDEQITKIGDDLLQKVTVEDGGFLFFDEVTPVFELDLDIDDVPDKDIQLINQAFRKHGLKPSKDDIIKKYIQLLRRKSK